jgi:hypothetical protein
LRAAKAITSNVKVATVDGSVTLVAIIVDEK